MWLSGKRARPAFTYTRAKRGGQDVLDDDVSFVSVASGRTKHILGVDTPDPHSGPNAFVWRGRGALFFITSRWRVAHIDTNATSTADGTWAVIAFSRTLFTPAGLDVVARAPSFTTDVRDHVHDVIAADATIAQLLSQLRSV